MSEKKIVVPEGMIKAACGTPEYLGLNEEVVGNILRAALRWQAEHAIVPSDEAVMEMIEARSHFIEVFEKENWVRWGATEWQRRMFVSSESKAQEAIKDLLWKPRARGTELDRQLGQYDESHDLDVIEAFRRGQKSVTK